MDIRRALINLIDVPDDAERIDVARAALADGPTLMSVRIKHELDLNPDTIGVYAIATVQYPIGSGSYRLQTFESGGLWGIASDSEPGYIEEVDQEQLDDLRGHLERFGVNVENFTVLAAKAAVVKE